MNVLVNVGYVRLFFLGVDFYIVVILGLKRVCYIVVIWFRDGGGYILFCDNFVGIGVKVLECCLCVILLVFDRWLIWFKF